MNRFSTSLALLAALLASQPASAAKKECPSFKAMIESLDRKLVGVKYQSVRAFFGGKHGHKWEAFSVFSASEFSTENTDFLSEARYYKLKYATLQPQERKDMAADLVTKYVKAGSESEVNLANETRQKVVQAYAKETANGGVPTENLFEPAFDSIRGMVANDSFQRFISAVKEKGLPSKGANGKVTYDTAYKGCVTK